MRAITRVRLVLATMGVSGICLLGGASSASAGAIGNWNSNTGCPVDDPAMLASPAGDYTACVGYFAGGPWKVGNLRLRAALDGDFGAFGTTSDALSVVPGPTPYPSQAFIDGVYPGTPILGLCSGLPGSRPYDPNSPYAKCVALSQGTDPSKLFTMHVEQLGAGSGFSLAGLTDAGPLLTVPVKLHLETPAFGPDCYIGSDAGPIVLNLASSAPAVRTYSSPDPNGYPVTSDDYYAGDGSTVDTSFTVPKAHGCGSLLMDRVLDLALGLPSPSGNNSVSLYRDFSIQSTTAGGTVLSQAYHTALDR